MKTIVSFSLLCALLLAMFLLTPLVKSWGASHPGTLNSASYTFQIESRKDLPSSIPGAYGTSLAYARIGHGKITLAAGYGHGYRHGYRSPSKTFYGRGRVYRYHSKAYRGKSHAYTRRHKGYYVNRDLHRDYYKGFNAGRYAYKPYRRHLYGKGYPYRYPQTRYWYYYGYCY